MKRFSIQGLLMQAVAIVPLMFLHGAALWAALFVYLLVSNNVVANTAKTRAIEGRVSTLEGLTFPNTGGVVAGPVAANGNISAQGVSSTASVAGTSGHFTASVQVDGNHSVSGQVLVNGASSAAAIAANGDAHMSGTVTGDSGVNTSGNFSGGSIHVSGNSQTDGTHTVGGDVNASGTVRGAVHASSIVIDTMSAVGSPASSSNAITYCNNIKQAVDGILNRM
jgi:hypothetical protein